MNSETEYKQKNSTELLLNESKLKNDEISEETTEHSTGNRNSVESVLTSSKFQTLQVPGQQNQNLGNVGRGWRSIRHAVNIANAAVSVRKGLSREDSFIKKFSTRQPYRADSVASVEEYIDNEESRENGSGRHHSVLHPDGNLMFYWLGLLTIAILYNLWTCIAREAFREIQVDHVEVWIACDIFCDVIYVCDIVIQIRTGYLDQGIMVYNSKKLFMKYIHTKQLYVDILCLLPLDFLQFYIGIHAMLRFPRFIKVYRTFRFMHMLESRTQFPNFFRVANLTHILFLGSHWFAAFYYLISEAENFEGDWSYPKPEGQFSSVTRKYLASLFWSTLTLTTIGDLPPPQSNWEYAFVIVSYLIGVFIFATIVGQVGNVITNRNASRQEFERLLDGAKMYMRMHNVPTDVQKRVQRWYDYVWTRGRMKGSDINSLGLLPDKLKTELAIHVNLETLKKVTIFQECQPEFLHDLVLKMRAYIFTPGDLICRRGEVAREMFIIADGLVEIISESGTVLTKMETGDFFGEIGILNLDGGINRRTADVKSVGYSELFLLSREDVLEALKDHPEAEQIIREYGQKRLKEIEEHRQKMKTTGNTPTESTPKWSPSSPAKHFRRKKDVTVELRRREKGSHFIKNGIALKSPKRDQFRIIRTMRSLLSRADYKQSKKKDSQISEVSESSDASDDWPIIARLPQGEVISIANKRLSTNRRYSFPTVVEKAMEANKKGLLFPDTNRVSDSSAGIPTICIQDEESHTFLPQTSTNSQDKPNASQTNTINQCSNTNSIHHIQQSLSRENSRREFTQNDTEHVQNSSSDRSTCCCESSTKEIQNIYRLLDHYGASLDQLTRLIENQNKCLGQLLHNQQRESTNDRQSMREIRSTQELENYENDDEDALLIERMNCDTDNSCRKEDEDNTSIKMEDSKEFNEKKNQEEDTKL